MKLNQSGGSATKSSWRQTMKRDLYAGVVPGRRCKIVIKKMLKYLAFQYIDFCVPPQEQDSGKSLFFLYSNFKYELFCNKLLYRVSSCCDQIYLGNCLCWIQSNRRLTLKAVVRRLQIPGLCLASPGVRPAWVLICLILLLSGWTLPVCWFVKSMLYFNCVNAVHIELSAFL